MSSSSSKRRGNVSRGRDEDDSLVADPLPLQMIDPSPIDSPPITQGPSKRPPTIALWLIKTQRLSSYVFTGFLGIHFTTTALIPNICSFDTAENSLVFARVLYQSPLIESCAVIGSLALHLVSGIALRVYRMKEQSKKYGSVSFRDISAVSYSGYILLPLVCIHVLLMRGLPIIMLGGSEEAGLRFVAHALGRFPLLCGALHTSLIGVGLFHFGQGWCKWIQPTRVWRRSIIRCSLYISAAWYSGLYFITRVGTSAGHLGRQFDHVYSSFFVRA